jgi:hypothetical protein
MIGWSKPQDVPREPTKGEPGAALTLLSFEKFGNMVLSATPFAGKVEMALRMAGIEFDGLKGSVIDPQHAPKHKVCPRRW